MKAGRRFRFDYASKTMHLDDEVYDLALLERSESGRRRAVLVAGDFKFSIIWGACTYSDNYDAGLPGEAPFEEEPFTVEVMTVGGDLEDGVDEPRGWQSVGDVLRLIKQAEVETLFRPAAVVEVAP